ncbi:Protein ASP-7 [Aphelenchoides avenae]|nr:Protein ASP-7 [Aphelenchus avenae]
MRSPAALSQPLSRNFTDSGPFGGDFSVFRDEVFTIDVTLGTPAKKYNATLDYHWSYSFFFSAGHPEWPCVIPMDGGMPWRRDYIPKASASAVKSTPLPFSGFDLEQPYVPEGCPQDFTSHSDIMWTDTLKIGPHSFQFPFAYYTDTWGNLDFFWPSDAILGLGRVYDSTNPTNQCGIYQVLEHLPKNVVTVYFDSNETSNAELNGLVTLGGVDALNCDHKWSSVPTVQDGWNNGWSVYVTTFSYGKKFAIKQRTVAILKATTALITAPPNVVDYVVVQAGAEYDFKSDTYQLPCSTIGTLPDMVFQLGTFEYRLPDKDYIRQLPSNKPGQCTLMLDEGDYVEDKWTLGSTFGRSYCTLFDYDTNKIGFAKVLH